MLRFLLVWHVLIVAVFCELFAQESGYSTGYAPTYHNYKPRDYQFDYAVSDPHTGDHKSQWEVKQDGVVRGAYSLLEPDGTTRIVEYIADDGGFRAVVKKIGVAVHPEVVHDVVPLQYQSYNGQINNYAPAFYSEQSFGHKEVPIHAEIQPIQSHVEVPQIQGHIEVPSIQDHVEVSPIQRPLEVPVIQDHGLENIVPNAPQAIGLEGVPLQENYKILSPLQIETVPQIQGHQNVVPSQQSLFNVEPQVPPQPLFRDDLKDIKIEQVNSHLGIPQQNSGIGDIQGSVVTSQGHVPLQENRVIYAPNQGYNLEVLFGGQQTVPNLNLNQGQLGHEQEQIVVPQQNLVPLIQNQQQYGANLNVDQGHISMGGQYQSEQVPIVPIGPSYNMEINYGLYDPNSDGRYKKDVQHVSTSFKVPKVVPKPQNRQKPSKKEFLIYYPESEE